MTSFGYSAPKVCPLPIELPTSRSLDETVALLTGQRVLVWSTPGVAERLRTLIPWPVATEQPELTDQFDWLLAAGGGALIDQAKLMRQLHPSVKLAALPTLWGSGAEASPIAVTNADGKKVIRIGQDLLPDLIVSHPGLAKSAPAEFLLHACGDAWSHALEGFLSPLGNDQSRRDLAEVMKRMLAQPLAYSAEWFELGALACAAQAKTSVGLVHGIAHVLEDATSWRHARLCSLYLLPVMSFNRHNSPKWALLAEHGLEDDVLFAVQHALFNESAYRGALPLLESRWMTVLRDPCSRTNSALVRPRDIAFFTSFQA
jgi:hypothetical protein